MIVNTLAYLVIISIIGFLKGRMRVDRTIAWVMFFSSFFLFYDYIEQILKQTTQGFSFVWNESNLGNITIDFNPTSITNSILVPLFFVSILTILNNNIFKYEERRCTFNALVLLNFVALSLLLCSKNYVQLITSIFASDILGYVLLKDVDSSRRYVIYNFFADMCLFMVLSLVSGRIESIEISKLITYEQIGRHKDFVSLITIIALFIKLGAFSFQTYLLDISSSRFQRMSTINILFCPISGLLLLLKLHNLLIVSNLFIPLFKFVSILTFLTGVVFFIIKDDIRQKTVYFNMANIGSLMIMIYQNSFSWHLSFSYYYIIMYFYNVLLFKLYLYENRQDKVSEMINAKEINKEVMIYILLLITLLTNLFISITLHISKEIGFMLPFYLSIVISLSLTIMLNHIYKSPKSRRLDYLNKNSSRIISFIVNSLIIILATYHFGAYNKQNLSIIILFLLIIALPCWSYFRKLYTSKTLQSNSIATHTYLYLIVQPLMYISRHLWLMIDTLFQEKVIENITTSLNRFGISLFFKFNKKHISNIIGFILLGFTIFIISFYKRELP